MKLLDEAAAAAVPVRPAATTLVLRDSFHGIEVLMVKRSPTASFMPGAYVFPGGAVDDADAQATAASDEGAALLDARIDLATGHGAGAGAYAMAALRECFEESGLWLGTSGASAATLQGLRERLNRGEPMAALARESGLPLATSALGAWSRWITPVGLPRRFDTLFFVCRAPDDQEPLEDATETTTLRWVVPGTALLEHAMGRFPMEFATVRTVQSLLRFAADGVDALLRHAATQGRLAPLQPRILRDAKGVPVAPVLPGEPGYDA